MTEERADSSTDRYNMNAVLKYDNTRKYCLQLFPTDFEDRNLPDCLVNITKNRGKIQCTTLDLKKLNQRVSAAAEKAVLKSDEVLEDLLDGIRHKAEDLFRICDGISRLDMIASFAHVVTIRDYVRPDLARTLGLQAARHPILDKVLALQTSPAEM